MKTWTLALCLTLAVIAAACSPVREDYPVPPPSHAFDPGMSGPFADIEARFKQTHGPDVSGFLLLDDGEEALNWLLTLIDLARHSLDMQYYLWYPDDAGRLVTKRVLDAAKRGVRVRLIVDGILLFGSGEKLAAMDAHPNIDVRVFNPWEQVNSKRSLKSAQFLERVNYRMHNKLIVADNHIAALGGRNIGNEYFGLNSSFNFLDLDVLGVGPMARQASQIFDHFFNSPLMVPGPAYEHEAPIETLIEGERAILEMLEQSDRLERFALDRQSWSDRLASLPAKLLPGTSAVIYDTLEDQSITQNMASIFPALGGAAQREVLVSNAYVIPETEQLKRTRAAVERGVTIRVLTNSLASQDMPAVHSHYGPLRPAILEAGAELYELKPNAAVKQQVDTPPVVSELVGLHMKTAVVDRERVFIGSFNLDPRSREINTEMGILINSPPLAESLAGKIESYMAPQNSWRVGLNDKGKLFWKSGDEVLTRQPALNASQRFQDWYFRLFPKEYF
jgi:putative cardiolipin synthase